MGFEDYNVSLHVCRAEQNQPADAFLNADDILGAIRREWPAIHEDKEALEWLPYRPDPRETFLCYETEKELFQICIRRQSPDGPECAGLELRFAYCNPRSVYEPFCALIEWAMRKYSMQCTVMRDLGPPEKFPGEDGCRVIRSPDQVRAVLVPSMDYNRHLWHLDAGTTEEAPLRPEEAIERFILPQCEPLNARNAVSEQDDAAVDEPAVAAEGKAP